ncbi:hypothetical protein QR680_003988 [Steinernema hermaphroditum]|uniref:Saposin B-type domain-containing protein n=1 Tax=Steinernema hermaphroditum TaxID=289476 RepID=A0AA39HMA4_9BILA|nr:hypothetical protein QR680_003988 [Steinernema hermaphroditum]
MRTLIALLCLVAAVSAAANLSIWGAIKKVECDICYDIVDDTESWLGKEGEKDEGKIVSKCDKFADHLSKAIAKEVCDKLLKTGFDDIVHHLADPAQEKKDAATVCGDLRACPRK